MNRELISIERSLLERYAGNATMLVFLVHVILNTGEDGSFETSLNQLARDLKLSLRQVRTCLSKLESDKVATKTATKIATKITLCVSVRYEDERQSGDKARDKEATKRKKSPLSPPDGSSPDPSSFTPLLFPQEKKESSNADASEDKKRAPPVSPPSEFNFVLDLWNSSARRSVPKIRILSPARKEKVRLRVKEMGGWEEAKRILPTCLQKLNESDFCNGATGKWTATFDWFFENEKNWMKVLEGNYDNRKEKSELEKLAELFEKGHEHYGQRYGYGGASPYGYPAGSREDGPDEQ